jgi:16S rRNA (guanine527-N7)-methyltransferase
VAATGLADALEVARVRAEDLASDPRHRERWPAVVARAVASLPDLVELSFPLLAPGGSLVAWKSDRDDREDRDDEELAAGRRAVKGLGGGRIRIVAGVSPDRPDHRLVVATKRGATGSAYPRQPAARARRPW